MKNIRLLLLPVAVFLLAACSGKSVKGDWKVLEMESGGVKMEMAKEKVDMSLSFTDGSYTFVGKAPGEEGFTQKGKLEVNEDKQEMTWHSENEYVGKTKVTYHYTIDGDKMTISSVGKKDGTTMVLQRK